MRSLWSPSPLAQPPIIATYVGAPQRRSATSHSQPMFEHVIHTNLARAEAARAGLTPDPGVDWY